MNWKDLFLNQMGLPGKFLILGIIALLMVLLPSSMYFLKSQKEITSTQRELAAIEPVKALFVVIQAIQIHRGASAGVLGEVEGGQLSTVRLNTVDLVDRAVSQLDLAFKSSKAPKELQEQWLALHQRWIKLENNVAKKIYDSAESVRLHSELLADILILVEEFSSQFGLAVDPEADTYYLIQAALADLPRVIENMGLLRAHGVKFLVNQRLLVEDRVALDLLVQRTGVYQEVMARNFSRVNHRSYQSNELILDAAVGMNRVQVAKTLQLIQQVLIGAPQLTYSAVLYFDTLTQAMDSLHELNRLSLDTLKDRLDNRLAYLQQAQILMICILLLFSIAGGLLAVTFVRNITRTVREAIVVARSVAEGNLDVTVAVHGNNEFGQLMHALAIMRDRLFSAHKALEHQKFALDQHAIVATANVQGIITYANTKFCEISGYTRAELVGQDHALLNSGLHPKGFFKAMYQTVGRGQVWHGDICNRRKDGSLYWVKTTIVPTLDEDGKPTQYIAIRADITESKAAERELVLHRDHLAEMVKEQTLALQESHEQTRRALFDLEQQRFVIDQHAIVTICDKRGRITYGNKKFSEVSGFSPDEFIGQDHHIVNSGYHPKGFFGAMFETINAGEVWHAEVCNRAKDGSLYWVDSTTAAFMGDDGKPREYIAVRTDISERKRAEQSARAASQAKSDFLANMSHEIRTPLNAVLGLAQVGQRKSAGQPLRLLFDQMLASGKLLLGIINDILDYSKIEAGKLTIENEPVSRKALVEHLRVLSAGRALDKGITLNFHADEQLPEWFEGDLLRITQVLANLLSNAIKFTEKGGVEVNFAQEGGDTIISVQDTGIGLTEEQLGRLFGSFEQADPSTTRKFGGTGLGLAISKRLIELMGGSIVVSSRFGEGSRFTVRLPLREIEPPAGVDPVLGMGGCHVAGEAGHRLAGYNILVTDDNPVNQLVLGDLLSLEGAAFHCVDDGLKALELLEQQGVDGWHIILTDIQMPNMDGHQLAMRLRVRYPALPVVGLTAHAMEVERQRCFENGMVAHVSKPIDLEELVSVIRQHARQPDVLSLPDVALPLIEETVMPTAGEVAVGGVSGPGIIDWAGLLAKFSGRHAVIDKLVAAALRGTADKPALLHSAIEIQNFAELAFIAHHLKGTGGNMMAATLTESAARLEGAARAVEPAALELAGQLATIVEKFIVEIEARKPVS